MKSDKLAEVEKEIVTLLQECKREGLTKDELFQVFSPLGITQKLVDKYAASTAAGNKTNSRVKKSEQWKLPSKKTLVILATVVALVGVVVVLYDASPSAYMLRFKVMALVRIGLIKVLPFWKWTDLYYSRCLVRNPFFERPELNLEDCNLCENLDEIDRLSNTTQAVALDDYIRREKPFIVTDAMDDWPIMNTDQLWFDNITELYIQTNKHYVCNLNTNLRGSYDFKRIVRKIYNPRTTQWFLHWENCQKDGAKATRMFYRRPYFVSNSLDFTGSNWILMSSDFRGRVYKKIEPTESLMMMYQIRGFNHIRLSPRETCKNHCPELQTTVNEGEILVVENLLWLMEYIPGEYGDNLAIISEVSWPDRE